MIPRLLASALLLVVAGCAGSPADTTAAEPTPVTAETKAPVEERALAITDAPTEPAVAEAPTPPPAPATGPEGAYLPVAGREVRFTGFGRLADGQKLIRMVQTSSADAGEGRLIVERRVQREQDDGSFAEPDVARWAAWRAGDGVWLSAIADAVHDSGPTLRELFVPPQVGARWQLSTPGVTMHCAIEAIEEVVTFAGKLEHCARVRVETVSGTILRWHHPEFGTVRTEIRDPHGVLQLTWALVDGDWPSRPEIEKLLL